MKIQKADCGLADFDFRSQTVGSDGVASRIFAPAHNSLDAPEADF